ncbi:hypothetical protein [Zooshikella ganghwensis]|uniref:Uncharacterized protein n=1 Tax=Zooshikella ganghwensis TaxID=202772 RepID=A0A4P9VHE5_9GAMM|nr:hypothetical protein [Zooshikella ganghwensis]RDH41906.1 hypothetical protein B9G39_26175 [Zooshikella ganghwensis]
MNYKIKYESVTDVHLKEILSATYLDIQWSIENVPQHPGQDYLVVHLYRPTKANDIDFQYDEICFYRKIYNSQTNVTSCIVGSFLEDYSFTNSFAELEKNTIPFVTPVKTEEEAQNMVKKEIIKFFNIIKEKKS